MTRFMELFAVFGQPIHHSLSPQMHNAAFKYLDRPAFYLPVQCPPHELLQRLDAFRQLGGRGVNLTRPLKELIVPHLQSASSWVEKAQAANVIVWQEGSWVGDNTDVQALMASIPDTGPHYFGKVAWVLGQGGVARASVVALEAQGYEVIVFGRRSSKPSWHHHWVEWDNDMFRHPRCDVFVNATPLGQIGEHSWDVRPEFDPHTIVVDWVYRPNNTVLLTEGRQAGCQVVDGLSLLVKQAALSWQLWFGMPGPLDVMENAVREFFYE
ncbi:shikimate dehydrogenase family protein [Sulfobacillus thermosulfidooxidans]|uniref:shikimate dehydrogenase family protein n=2 Tax=Sulfobacillus thermosulfidooxidans TaxID=28034 RepID=UPI00117D6907|nr:shikimate dehydrogenase [Sulfobacillus thermosulfidooxidans]